MELPFDYFDDGLIAEDKVDEKLDERERQKRRWSALHKITDYYDFISHPSQDEFKFFVEVMKKYTRSLLK